MGDINTRLRMFLHSLLSSAFSFIYGIDFFSFFIVFLSSLLIGLCLSVYLAVGLPVCLSVYLVISTKLKM